MNSLQSHPKIVPLSDGAFRLYVNALCWCNEHLTDGAIPESILPALAPGLQARPGKAADELVTARLWHRVEDGWAVHDYLDVQTSAAKVAEKKAKAAERMAAARASVNGGCAR